MVFEGLCKFPIAAKPGAGLQKLHVDWHESAAAQDYKVCNSIWLLDGFSRENGATRVVPGTHLLARLPQDVLFLRWIYKKIY